jgi:hypothetical protein
LKLDRTHQSAKAAGGMTDPSQPKPCRAVQDAGSLPHPRNPTAEHRSASAPPHGQRPSGGAISPFRASPLGGSDCYNRPAPLRGPMSSKRRRFDRRGVDPGLVLIVGIAVRPSALARVVVAVTRPRRAPMRDGIPRGERRESIPVGRRQVSGVGLFQRLTAARLKAITLDK